MSGCVSPRCLVAAIAALLAVWAGYYMFQSEFKYYRFGSFAPERTGCQAKWFVDGKDYMSAVADFIQNATNEIFIADWQLNPHIFMKRPDTGVEGLEWRLDEMLRRKADDGVMIYILLYWETKQVMDIGSDFSQSVLKHQNITVVRHPDAYSIIRHPFTMGRWTHHEKMVVIDRSIAFVGGIDLAFGRWDTHKHELTDNYPLHPCVRENDQCNTDAKGAKTRYQHWVGKDYGNTFVGGSRTEFDKPLNDYIDRGHDPRMPWHDIGCLFTGPPAHDVANYFIQRYNSAKPWWKFWGHNQLYLDEEGSYDYTHTIPHPSSHNLRIQVLRSVDKWSAGQPHEASIYNAYLHAIRNAEHFIYIENQFFISSQPGVFMKVENEIQNALADRIAQAYENNEDFHVFIVMPLKPEFPGEWGGKSDLNAISYWNYATIYSGEHSLFSRLKKKNILPAAIPRYLSVYGLRTHGVLNGKPVTEIIYVHSKTMIVDDQLTIIGSANMNDRSMLGSRDSEVAVVIEDTDMVNGKMNGRPYRLGMFSHSLRCLLFREHLGLLNKGNEAVEDPMKDTFYKDTMKVAEENTYIYEMVFHRNIDPTNQVWNYEDLENWRAISGLADIDPQEAIKELRKIRGNLVIFPELFLHEVLKPSYLDYVKMYVDSRGHTTNINFDGTETVFV